MKAIIFGIHGQDGYYLESLLQRRGISVIGVSRGDESPASGLTNFPWVKELIRQHQPEYIFHFAAQSTTRHDVLFENHETICTGTLNILEAVRTVSPGSKVFISGSGLQFKNTGEPITSSDPFDARDAYSVSRIHSVYAARYFRSLGVKAYVGYFFNHDSPRRNEQHVSKMIANAVKDIAAGSSRVIEIGKLAVEKEWAFAGDIVEAVWTLVNQESVWEAIISSGKSYSILEYVQTCFEFIGKDWKQFVREKPGFEAGYERLVGDPSIIMSLGWIPKTDFKEFVKFMLTE